MPWSQKQHRLCLTVIGISHKFTAWPRNLTLLLKLNIIYGSESNRITLEDKRPEGNLTGQFNPVSRYDNRVLDAAQQDVCTGIMKIMINRWTLHGYAANVINDYIIRKFNLFARIAEHPFRDRLPEPKRILQKDSAPLNAKMLLLSSLLPVRASIAEMFFQELPTR